MFEAREIYCEEGKIPKKMIWQWSEKRMLGFLFIFMGIIVLVELIFFCLNERFYLMSSIDGILDYDGGFYDPDYNKGVMSIGCLTLAWCYFYQVVLLLWAIYKQWQIDSEYNISRELLAITLVWFICSQFLTQINIFSIAIFSSNNSNDYNTDLNM